MKRASLLILFLLLSCFMTTVGAEGVPANSSANYLPENTSVFMSVKNYKRARELFVNTGFFKFAVSNYGDTLLKSITGRKSDYKIVRDIIEILLEITEVSAETQEDTESLAEFGIAQGKNRIGFIFSFKVSEDKQEAILGLLEETVLSMSEMDLKFVKKEREGFTYFDIMEEGNEPERIVFFLMDGRINFAFKGIFDMAIRVKKAEKIAALSSNPSFQSRYRAEAQKEGFIYASIQSFSDLINSGFKEDVCFSVGTKVTEQGFFERAHIDNGNYFNFFAGNEDPLTLNCTRFMPQSVPFYFGMKIPMDLRRTCELLGIPGYSELWSKALGKEIAVYANSQNINQEFLAAIELEDIQAAGNLLDTLSANGPLEKKKFGESDIYILKPDAFLGKLPLIIAFVIKDNYLLAGTIFTVKDACFLKEEDSLFGQEEVKQKISNKLENNPDMIFYGDIPKIINAWWPLISKGMDTSFFVKVGNNKHLTLPLASEMAAFFKEEYITFHIGEKETEITTTGDLPLLSYFSPILGFSLADERDSNEYSARCTVSHIMEKAGEFSRQFEQQFFWENGTTDFGKKVYFKEHNRGYTFRYFSNDTNNDGAHEATAFICIAYPDTNGRIFISSEEMKTLFGEVTTEQIQQLATISVKDIDWKVETGKRINIAGLPLEDF